MISSVLVGSVKYGIVLLEYVLPSTFCLFRGRNPTQEKKTVIVKIQYGVISCEKLLKAELLFFFLQLPSQNTTFYARLV